MEDGRLKLGSKAGGQCDKGFSTADRIVQTEITQISDVERRTSNVRRAKLWTHLIDVHRS